MNHKELVEHTRSYLITEGYSVLKEKELSVYDRAFRTDIWAKKNDNILLVECGKLDTEKLSVLLKQYDVLHVAFDGSFNWFRKNDNQNIVNECQQELVETRIIQKMTPEQKEKYDAIIEKKHVCFKRMVKCLILIRAVEMKDTEFRIRWFEKTRKLDEETWSLLPKMQDLEKERNSFLQEIALEYPTLMKYLEKGQ